MSGLLREVVDRYWAENRLHTLVMELTARCPCRCQHCYIVPAPPVNEMTTAEVCDVLDQAQQEGVFQLQLTGGDVFLRQDLDDVLAHVRRRGFFVNVLTSGLLVDSTAAAMLARHKVRSVELSLLGATDAVNDGLMGAPGALAKIRQAVGCLREAGLPVVLKSTLMRQNAHELAAMAALGAELDAEFHASPLLAPRRDGGTDPRNLALTETQVAALDQNLLNAGLMPGEDSNAGAVLVCNAGRSIAGVAADGTVYPCIMWPRDVGSLRARSLQDIWHDRPDPFLAELRALSTERLTTCQGCAVRDNCRRCPGMAWQETGDLLAPGSCFCRDAHERAQALR